MSHGHQLTPLSSKGVQGTLDTAANGTLKNEFGTHNVDEVLEKVLSEGILQEVEGAEDCMHPVFSILVLTMAGPRTTGYQERCAGSTCGTLERARTLLLGDADQAARIDQTV